MSDEIKCLSCGIHLPSKVNRCFLCGRVLQDTINLTLEKGLNIGVRKWKFSDVEGKEHEVIALQWGATILHFGEDGLYTDLFK